MKYIKTAKKYANDVKIESLKIVWPDKKYLINSTLMICGILLVVSLCLLCIDFLSNKLIASLLRIRLW